MINTKRGEKLRDAVMWAVWNFRPALFADGLVALGAPVSGVVDVGTQQFLSSSVVLAVVYDCSVLGISEELVKSG